MIVLALDLATTTGVAVGPARGTPECSVLKLGSDASHPGARFAQLRISLAKLIKKHQPQRLAIEAPLAAGGGGAASRVTLAMGLRATVMLTAYHASLPVDEVAVQTVRKHFLGHGRLASSEAKSATVRRCRSLGWDVPDHNAADAAALWDCVCNRYGRLSAVAGGLFDTTTPPTTRRKARR